FNCMALQIRQQVDDLETERGKLAAVLDHITDGILIVDAKGSIQLLNPAAGKMFGIALAQTTGQSLPEALRVHQPYDLWQKSRETQEIQQTSFEFKKRIILQAFATPLGQSLPGHTLLLFQDITHQKQVEAMRRDFISNVSHELRTPLAALKSLTETLRDGALEDPSVAQQFLDRMETEVDALSLMVMELLELSRIESGRVPLNLQPTRPLDMINAAHERICLQAERAGLNLAVDCPSDLPVVQADALRIQQVLVNLLHNAIKFTPAGGNVQMVAVEQGEAVVFYVRDAGIGIAPLDLPRIFERFYKADRARSGGGTGLGLAISRHMVESHSGRIWAESQLDQGSTFYFTLPKASQKP
ncbi:MAG: ATP-binding protein, partial [Anaerolineaceae bacterium]|nr:ATP-binding protein [Anaerolineaceae bacterium]